MKYAAILGIGAIFALAVGCTATRVVTTQATHVKHGDTTTTIVTKTIERYDMKRQLPDM